MPPDQTPARLSLDPDLHLVRIRRYLARRCIEGLHAIQIIAPGRPVRRGHHVCAHCADAREVAGSVGRPLEIKAVFVSAVVDPPQRDGSRTGARREIAWRIDHECRRRDAG